MGIEIEDKSFLKTIHTDLLWIKKHVYEPIGLLVQNLKIEDESADYGAAEFTIDNQRIKFRVGKITPTKIGQFVTFWKRVGNGSIMPYDFNDPFDLLVISVRNENRFGQFIFSKAMLCEKGLVSKGGSKGKRAMRIYPSWDKTDNQQAKKTQTWQNQCFIEMTEKLEIDFTRVQGLFNS